MTFAGDFSVFFNPDEFGDLAMIGSRQIRGMFTDEYREELDVEGESPVFICPTSALPIGMTHGTVLTVQGGSYVIVGIQPDATGLTVLILEKIA